MPVPPPRRRGPRLTGWVVLGLALVLGVVAAVWPWDLPSGAAPTTSAPVATSTAPPVPTTPAVTPSPTTRPVDLVHLDPTTVGLLLVGTAELRAAVPGLGPGLSVDTEQGGWGLPDGAVVDPATCLPARTVVTTPPVAFESRRWHDESVDFRQDVLLLDDPATARADFATLVATLDECPQYAQTGTDGSTAWEVEPALEGQGAYPSVVAKATVRQGDDVREQYLGHMRVGNTIVSWTATAAPGASGVLGSPDELDALVQRRASVAVVALS